MQGTGQHLGAACAACVGEQGDGLVGDGAGELVEGEGEWGETPGGVDIVNDALFAHDLQRGGVGGWLGGELLRSRGLCEVYCCGVVMLI